MNVDDALILTAFPMQLDVAQRFHIWTIHDDVDERQERQVVPETLEQVACVEPDGLFRKTLANLRDKLTNGLPISGTERVAARKGHAVDIVAG